MIYKCRDCEKEYTELVEYCECGNNTFDIIEEVVSEKSNATKNKKKVSLGDKISLLIFLLCVISSIIILLFVGNVEDSKHIIQKAVPTENSVNIPDISKIWDDTPVILNPQNDVKIEANDKLVEPKEEKNPMVFEEPDFVKEIFKPVQKPVAKPVTKPVTKRTPITLKQNKVQDVSVNLPIKTEENVKKTEIKRTDYNDPTFISYKKNLMQRFFSKFPVGGISGDGVCVVSFSISNEGKLLNRKFETTSDNKTLNDAVYYMMMSVPTFSRPPASYQGDVLRVKVIFKKNTYEFSYI